MKLHYCFLERFNNYFNRKIIKYSTILDYENHSKNFFIPTNTDSSPVKYDFNPNDNVTTEIIENNVPFDPDYILIFDDDNNIVQRWFILEQKRNRQGQWLYYLRRDVIADNLDNLFNAPIYVLKGHLKENDPFIFNDEGLPLNQIKVSDEIIKDSYHDTAWIVGYMANDASASNVTGTPQSVPTEYTTLSAIATAIGGNMTEADLIAGIDGTIEFNANNKIRFYYSSANFVPIHNDGDSELSFADAVYENWAVNWIKPVGSALSFAQLNTIMANNTTWLNANTATVLNAINTNHGIKYHTTSQLSTLMSYNGKCILYGGRYYKLNINSNATSKVEFNFSSKLGSLSGMTSSAGWTAILDDGLYYFEYDAVNITLQLDEQPTTALKVDISSTHNTLYDAPYSIFAIPFNTAQTFELYSQHIQFKHISGDAVIDMATAIAKALTTNKLYDLQLVPYCPIDWTFDNWDLEGNNTNSQYTREHIDYDLIKDGDDNPVGVVYYLKNSNFKTYINKKLNIKDNLKVDSNCRFYRLCSPNYNGVFDFNLAKNGGSISTFYVDGTLKPYNPYFRIAPQFDLLYGSNYNDGRGLICGGDFSLPIMSNAWENYQVTNKNFRSIFAREIQNLSVMQKQESFIEKFTAGANVFTSGTAGAIGGAQATGSPYGAIAGAVVGAGSSFIGGVVDVAMGEERRKEQRDYMIDRFNYNLMNIKALPDSLAKNSSFTINNKLQPFIELYEPTPEEITAFKRKIEYDGMTVNRIGYLSEFYEEGNMHYFKGQLIRNDEIADDTHILNSICEELLKGVYI